MFGDEIDKITLTNREMWRNLILPVSVRPPRLTYGLYNTETRYKPALKFHRTRPPADCSVLRSPPK